jgi:hypothetical protein
MEVDSASANLERGIQRRREEEEDALTRGTMMSASEREGKRARG